MRTTLHLPQQRPPSAKLKGFLCLSTLLIEAAAGPDAHLLRTNNSNSNNDNDNDNDNGSDNGRLCWSAGRRELEPARSRCGLHATFDLSS